MGFIRRARTAVLAAAVTGTLIAGTVSAGAAQAPAAGTTAQDGKGAPAGGRAKKEARPSATVTLVTGDRVVVKGDGSVEQLLRGAGREGIAFSVRREGAYTYVIPQDALRLVADGVLDRRLFDVAGLVRDGYDDAHRTTLPLIAGYRRDASGAKTFGAAGDTLAAVARDRRELPAVAGEAFNAPKADAAALWTAVTGRKDARMLGSAPVPPVAHLWLDGKVSATLDKSVPQIGAPAMWKAGFTGKGVKVAVLDTGVDETHPDLKGVETLQKNFSSSPDSKDRYGHGTHVASTIAGSGARSGGLYKGVAPGVQLLDGKVLGDDGFGSDSEIISGMQWAVDQGATVVNMSLGAPDEPGVDPKEEAVAQLSGKALFVVAAGNEGDKARTLRSPGSATAALTVGAVDKQDQLAEFSSRGPTADGLAKPDITAPGVGITAAASTQGTDPAPSEGYVGMSGTSMATPHVAGAAALVKQQHPTWSPARLKALLTASATPNPKNNAYQQGAGRVDLVRAGKAVVTSTPGSLAFGTQLWPHADDKPVSKSVTYRNHGTKPVTLKLTTAGTDPSGRPAPAGMFTVKDAQLTVPAGGSATTTVTADTRKGTVDGAFGGTVLAAGDGQEVRTGLVVEREVESYDVTLRHLDVKGGSPATYYTTVTRLGTGSEGRFEVPYDPSGTVVQRLPKGEYLLEGVVWGPDSTLGFFVQPLLKLTGKTTVTFDSRKAKPFAVTPPDPSAKLVSAYTGFYDEAANVSDMWSTDGATKILTQHLGPATPTLHGQYNGLWKTPGAAGKNIDYRLAFNRTGTWFDGLDRKLTLADVAEVKLGFGASVAGAKGLVHATPTDSGGYTSGIQDPAQQSLPYASTQYVSAGGGMLWTWVASQVDSQGEARAIYTHESRSYQPGRRYTLNFNTGVVGPDLKDGQYRYQEATRYGDYLDFNVGLFNDGAGHEGYSLTTGGFTRLESGGKIIVETPPDGWLSAKVPAGKATYRLTKEATRSTKDTATSTKVSAVWTFTSARPATDEPVALPLSTVRLSPKLSLNGTAPAGGALKVPLVLGGAAAKDGQVASLAVRVSYDGGKTWQLLAVATDAQGARSVTVKHPASAKAASFRVDLKDKAGNTVRETITNAYLLAP
ncbi:S8 family peptidase [Streptomyces sp. NBC_01264]|uniref:S8 family peptidase n=1 Tax=Streptomyces sp. NBC_01264 TaxID=2903804 RepID=UPI002257184C|nr:S8 family serine peptidase [Streptomyces sp. NBC_01264]MCX4775713.1 S8 family serine peptidase [Streptomyces sp. NBC_01264]